MKDKVISVIAGIFAAAVLLIVFQALSVFVGLHLLADLGKLTKGATAEIIGNSAVYAAYYVLAAFTIAYVPTFIAQRVKKTASLVPAVATLSFVLLLYVINAVLLNANVLLYMSSIAVVLIGGWLAILQQKRRIKAA